MADNETIADIIAEMRSMGNYQRYSGDHARVLANRLDAAHRRERGNAAKLREALEAIDKNTDLLDIAENIAPELHPSHSFVAVQIRKIVRAALDTTSKQNTQEEN